MSKGLLFLVTAALVAVLAAVGVWLFYRSAAESKALSESVQRVALPPGSEYFVIEGDIRDGSYYVRANYANLSVPEAIAYYRAYFEENNWENNFPPDMEIEGLLDYQQGRVSMNVTAIDLRGETHVMVIYTESEYTQEEFDTVVATSATPEALELVAAIIDAYRNLTSYSDRGTVKWTMDGKTMTHAEFSTAYVAPDRLRFSYSELPDSFFPVDHELALWGDQVQHMSGFDEEPEIGEDVSLAIASLYGVTGTASGSVPELLLGFEEESALFNLAHLTMLGDATLEDGTICRRLQGTNYNGNSTTVWAGKEDYLIRRIERAGDKNDITIIDYAPESGVAILAEALEFRRPASADSGDHEGSGAAPALSPAPPQ